MVQITKEYERFRMRSYDVKSCQPGRGCIRKVAHFDQLLFEISNTMINAELLYLVRDAP